MLSTRIELNIDKRRIAWLRFLLESYEGLALLRTLDPVSGRVVLLIGPGAEAETYELLEAVQEEIGLTAGLSDDWPTNGAFKS